MKIAASTSMGRVAYNHDLRITHTDNVNTYLSRNNVILIDELKGKTIDEYIDMLLQPSIDEYNAKQKRKDRKINMSYSEWHKLNDNKGEMVYEFVMQYGEHKDLGSMYYNGSEKDQQKLREEFIEVYTKWLKDWKEQHPNQKILWATIHFDENGGTPHMHLAVCPLSQDFKRGPQCQISMSKSLESDGFKRIDTKKEGYQLERAFHKFRETQERDLKERGYEIKPYKGGKHLDCETYKQVMQEATQRLEKAVAIETFTKELNEIEAIERLPSYDPKQVKTVEVKQGLFSQKEEVIQMSTEQFDALRASADTKAINRETEKKIKAQQKAIQKVIEDASTDREKDLQTKVDQLEERLTKAERTIQEKNIIIEQKDRLINKLESILEIIKDSLERRGLWKIFENLFERKDRTL